MAKLNLKPYTKKGKNKSIIYSMAALLGVAFVLLPSLALAQGELVPCAGLDCDVCHLYQLARNIMDFILKKLVLPIAVIAIIASGIIWLTSAGSEQRVALGKTILWYAVIGFLLAFAAWVIVNTILNTLLFKIPFKGNLLDWFNTELCKESPFKVGVIKPPPEEEELRCSADSVSAQTQQMVSCVLAQANAQGLSVEVTATNGGSHTCIIPSNISCHYGGRLCNGVGHAADFALTSGATPANWALLRNIAASPSCGGRSVRCERGSVNTGCNSTTDHVHANDSVNCGCN